MTFREETGFDPRVEESADPLVLPLPTTTQIKSAFSGRNLGTSFQVYPSLNSNFLGNRRLGRSILRVISSQKRRQHDFDRLIV